MSSVYFKQNSRLYFTFNQDSESIYDQLVKNNLLMFTQLPQFLQLNSKLIRYASNVGLLYENTRFPIQKKLILVC